MSELFRNILSGWLLGESSGLFAPFEFTRLLSNCIKVGKLMIKLQTLQNAYSKCKIRFKSCIEVSLLYSIGLFTWSKLQFSLDARKRYSGLVLMPKTKTKLNLKFLYLHFIKIGLMLL